jgi:6-phosphogluconolactonase
MNNFELLCFPTDLLLSQAAATAWLDDLAPTIRAGKPYFVALAGGRITLKFFGAVIESSKRSGVSLAEVHFFWGDERCVPPNHPESNFAAANQHFLQPLGIAQDKIHRIPGELPPDEAAAAATGEINRIVPPTAGGQPKLDLIFLGLGEDGHVASLFPGQSETVPSKRTVYRSVRNSPKPPPERVTLNYGAIASARQVWVLASGTGKAVALSKSLQNAGQTPLARVLQSRHHTRIFTDIPLLPSVA